MERVGFLFVMLTERAANACGVIMVTDFVVDFLVRCARLVPVRRSKKSQKNQEKPRKPGFFVLADVAMYVSHEFPVPTFRFLLPDLNLGFLGFSKMLSCRRDFWLPKATTT
jgi:hypothetical protein